VVTNEGQNIVALQNIKHKKHESTKYYYNFFLWFCVMMPQPLDDVYFSRRFTSKIENENLEELQRVIIIKAANLVKIVE
jgi:hypothetical protein